MHAQSANAIDFDASLRSTLHLPPRDAVGADTRRMPPRTLATLAHALSVAPDLDAALLALGDALSEVDRFAKIALVRFDARRSMLVDRLVPTGDTVTADRLDTTFDHLPTRERIAVA